MLVAMTKEETEKLIRIKNRILDMLVISEDDAYNFAHTCLTCGLDFVKRKRTEADILKDFEKLGYKFTEFTICYHLKKDMGAICKTIIINKNTHSYRCVIDNCTPHLIAGEIDMQEHKLLSELFEVWGWI